MTTAMADALAALPERVAIDRIDQLWLFPPRQLGDRESGLAVLSLFPDDAAASDRRCVLTLRYETPRGRRTRIDTLEEQGSAPVQRIPRVITGVVRRLTETDAPRFESIGGDPARWVALLASLRNATA